MYNYEKGWPPSVPKSEMQACRKYLGGHITRVGPVYRVVDRFFDGYYNDDGVLVGTWSNTNAAVAPFSTVEVPVERIVEKRVEVPVRVEVERRVEVPVEKVRTEYVYQDRPVSRTPWGLLALLPLLLVVGGIIHAHRITTVRGSSFADGREQGLRDRDSEVSRLRYARDTATEAARVTQVYTTKQLKRDALRASIDGGTW